MSNIDLFVFDQHNALQHFYTPVSVIASFTMIHCFYFNILIFLRKFRNCFAYCFIYMYIGTKYFA